MRTWHGIHWLAPGSMLGGLLAGVLLAVGHHLFYQSLDGTAASTINIVGTDLSRQQASIAIGTALAFLVKACLVYAITIAYIQVFWKEAKAKDSAPTLSTLDSISSAIEDLRVFFKFPLWLSYYLLLLMGTIAWLVPIASIITPATLATQLAPVLPVEVATRYVPNLDFRSLAFVDKLRPTFPSVYVYSGPSHPVMNVVGATMANGAILPLQPQAPNSSWEVDFFGPSIKCDPMNDTLHQQVRKSLFYSIKGFNGSAEDILTLYGYMGWFPHLGALNSGIYNNALGLSSPFYADGRSRVRFESGAMYHTFYLFAASRTLAEKYVNTSAGVDPWYDDLKNGSRSLPEWLDGTMLECRLLNSSYRVRFNYTNGLQQIKTQGAYTDGVKTPIVPYYSVYGPGFRANGSRTCLKLSHDLNAAGECIFDASAIRVLSYQAIWDAFTSVLKGSISYSAPVIQNRDSSVVDTTLIETPELSILRGIEALSGEPGATLQNALAAYDDPVVQGIDNVEIDVSNMSLAAALEEMFMNVTVSLMSSPALLPNNRSSSAPRPVNVTFPAIQLVYVYSPDKLWISYGVAILLTTITVAIGFSALWRNQASYSHDFSTIIRTAKGARLSTAIMPEDLRGHDPLPKYLEKAWLAMNPHVGATGAKPGAYQAVPLVPSTASGAIPLQRLPPQRVPQQHAVPSTSPQQNRPAQSDPPPTNNTPSQTISPQQAGSSPQNSSPPETNSTSLSN